jgi:hypothetical protein
VITATYRDDVELDTSTRNLGSQKVGGTTRTLRLVTLHGSGTGKVTLPIEDGFLQRQRTVTHVRLTARATAGGQTAVIHSTITDTTTQSPVT